MKINWQKTESTVKPREVDYETSPTTVYLHRNIQETEREGQKIYAYEEAKLSTAEYVVYAAEQNREYALTLMEGLIEIYNKIGGEAE